MNNKISDKDKKDWDNFLKSDDSLPVKDIDTKIHKQKKSYNFDLHGYPLAEANKKIKDLIYYAFENGINKLTIVTGKGLHSQNEKDPYVSKDFGILKNSVPEYIKTSKELMRMISSMKDADIEDGGSGAFYIFIKKKL